MHEHDPEYTVWKAVAELELKGYTRREIGMALRGADFELFKDYRIQP